MSTARRIAFAAMLFAVPLAATAAPLLVETRPSLELSSPGLSAPIELGDTGASSFRVEGPSAIDLGSSEGPGTSLQTRMFDAQALVRCKVDEADLLFANVGSDPIAAGTTIKWQVKGSGQRGYFNLTQSLGAGHSLRARNALRDTGGEGGRCTARAV